MPFPGGTCRAIAERILKIVLTRVFYPDKTIGLKEGIVGTSPGQTCGRLPGPPKAPFYWIVTPFRLCPDMCHQLGAPNPTQIVNARLPQAPSRIHDTFQIGFLTGFRWQSFFSLPKARSMGHPHVLLGGLLQSALRHL